MEAVTQSGGTSPAEAKEIVHGNMGAPFVDSEEELLRLLANDEPDGKQPVVKEPIVKKPAPVVEKETKSPFEMKGAKPAPATEDDQDDPDAKTDDDKDDQDEPAEFKTILHYLNDEHKFNLNLDQLPEDFSREDEAEYVSSLISRITAGANNSVRKYKAIETLMQDDEVKLLIQAKAEGKSLKDVIGTITSIDSNDESLATADFQKRYPKMAEADIKDMVDGLKKNGKLPQMAAAIREQYKEQEVTIAKQKVIDARKAEDDAQAETQERANQFVEFVGDTNKVYGIPISDDMKERIIELNLTPIDQNGNAEIDLALQTNEGRILASLGLAFLQKIAEDYGTTKANRKSKDLMSKLIDDPKSLTTASSRREPEKFDPRMANAW